VSATTAKAAGCMLLAFGLFALALGSPQLQAAGLACLCIGVGALIAGFMGGRS
jgi:hypothetical protein